MDIKNFEPGLGTPNITYSLSDVQLHEFAAKVVKEATDKLLEVKAAKANESNELLKVTEVIDLLRVSRVTLHEWARKGKLNPIKIGYNVRYSKSEIDRFIKEGSQK